MVVVAVIIVPLLSWHRRMRVIACHGRGARLHHLGLRAISVSERRAGRPDGASSAEDDCSFPLFSPGWCWSMSASCIMTPGSRCSPGSIPAICRCHGRCASTRSPAVMLVVVNTISSLVHLYSIGYMDEDRIGRASFATFRCHLRDVDVGDVRQPGPVVLRLGRRRLMSYLLIDSGIRSRRRMRRRSRPSSSSGRRFWLCARYFFAIFMLIGID